MKVFNKKIVGTLVIIFVLFIGIETYVFVSSKTTHPSLSDRIYDKTYTNEEYGFDIQYDSRVSQIKVKGNNIQLTEYIPYDDSIIELAGHGYITKSYLEIFPKDPNVSFEEAVRSSLLAKYPSPYCEIFLNDRPDLKEYGWEFASISDRDPLRPSPDSVGNEAYVYNCNPKYSFSSPMVSLLYNPQHPNVFFYYERDAADGFYFPTQVKFLK